MRRLVGVSPPPERSSRQRLFSALEAAFPVRFEARQANEVRGLDAQILIGDESAGPGAGPRRIVMRAQGATAAPGRVRLSTSSAIDARLRGWTTEEAAAGGLAGCVESVEADDVVGACGRTPLWARGGAVDRSSLAPPELKPDESLRDALVPGRWLALLPLVEFLREVCGESAWTPPPPRAAFVVDDPNLHRPSYGHVRFAELARHALEHGYHVAFATIPLDAWLVHPGTARLFRERRDVLSLLAHGNDHVRGELSAARPEREALALLAQAQRRLDALERRAGVPVARLMVAPYGLCSPAMMAGLLRAGFDGLCHGHPVARTQERLLAGWEIADVVEGGLPVFPRLPLDGPRDELVIRSYLDQPTIVYGHHGDLAAGLDVLAELSAAVARGRDVLWTSPERIARMSFTSRRDGATLRVRLHARRVELDLPPGVEQVVVELPAAHGEPERETVACRVGAAGPDVRSRFSGREADGFEVAGTTSVELRLIRDDAVDREAVASPPRRLRPYLRRAATESRDRSAPFRARIGRG